MKKPVAKAKKHQPGLKANYGGASPEEVARAVLRYRPTKPLTKKKAVK